MRSTELRNNIYGYVFGSGEKSHLQFLSSCRLVYLEAGVMAFSEIAISMSDNRHFNNYLPPRYRGSITTVRAHVAEESNLRDVHEACHYGKVYPVHISQFLEEKDCLEYASHEPGGRLHLIRLGLYTNPLYYDLHLLAIFGQFLANARLRKWTLRIPPKHACPMHNKVCTQITGVREDEDGRPISEKASRVQSAQRIPGSEGVYSWQEGLKVTVVEESGPDEVVVKICRKESADQAVKEFVRVRFKAIPVEHEK